MEEALIEELKLLGWHELELIARPRWGLKTKIHKSVDKNNTVWQARDIPVRAAILINRT